MKKEEIILTGDRPTGKLHLGHYIGSLCNRIKLQEKYSQFIIIADAQALTDNAENPEKVRGNILEVAYDYLATGISSDRSTIFIQSLVPELSELAFFYLNLVSVSRLQRNPTVKDEIKQRGFTGNVPAGFFVYPISQAADITAFKANLVPVGEDQLPMIEQTNEIVRKFNRIYKANVLKECKPIISKTSRLCGTDGKAKMSKSLNNAIFLSDSKDEIRKKINSMFTDPNHIHVSDPGKIEGNTVFSYLDAFASDTARVEELKEQYKRGGLGDTSLKNYLNDVLQELITPIRERREMFEKNKDQVKKILLDGSKKAREIASETLKDVKKAMQIDYLDL